MFLAIRQHAAETRWTGYPFFIGTAAIVCTLALWHGLRLEQTQSIVDKSRSKLTSIQLELQRELIQHESAFKRMGARWNANDRTSRAIWRDDAIHYLQDLSGFRSLAWVDEHMHVRRLEPSDIDQDQFAHAFLTDQPFREAVDLARSQKATTFAPPVRNTGLEFLVGPWLCVPVSKDGDDDGCLIANLDISALVSQVNKHISIKDLNITLGHDGHEVFAFGATQNWDQTFSLAKELPLGNSWLMFRGTPTRQWIRDHDSVLPEVVLAGGLACSVLLYAALQLGSWSQASRRQARKHLPATPQ